MKSFMPHLYERPSLGFKLVTFLPLLLLLNILFSACGETIIPASKTTVPASSSTTLSASGFTAGGVNTTVVAATTLASNNGTTTSAVVSASNTTETTSATQATTASNTTTAAAQAITASNTTTVATQATIPTNTTTAEQTTTAFSAPASTPNSTASADLPNLIYPGSREAKATDATAKQVLDQATGSDPILGDFTAQNINVLFTTDDDAKIGVYYSKLLKDAGYQINNQQSSQNGSVYIFQKNGVKIVINSGSVGADTSNLPKEFQSVVKPNDNLVLIITGKSTLAPTAVPTPVNIPGTPVATLTAGQKKIATITLENGSVITMELYPDIAPITVENFEKLANRGFYDGLTFHRIVPGFVVQGGDPNGDGSGGPGQGRDAANTKPYTIPGEFTTKIKHDYGIVAMARAQSPDSAGSQFYIVTGKAGDPSVDGLNGKYAIFGKVTSDMNIVLQIKQGDKMKTVRVENK